MQLISNGTQISATMPAKRPASGAPGYANNTPGNGTATVVDADVLNTWLAEIVNVVIAAGLALDPTNNAQLLAAVRAMFQPLLGFTPVQQGGGVNQQTNKVYLGWDGTAPRITVDTSDIGELALQSGLNAETARAQAAEATKAALAGNNTFTGSVNTFNGTLTAAVGTGFSHVLSFGASTSWTVPAGVFLVKVYVTGAGGGGSNTTNPFPPTATNDAAGGGGGAGGTAIGIYTVTPGQVIPITVAQATGNQGNGGTSSFGSFCFATGGAGSNFNAAGSSAGGAGGTASGGNILNLIGGYGQDGQGSGYPMGGMGGASYWGGGGRSGSSAGLTGPSVGSGGGGSYNGPGNGGLGQQGIVLVEY